MPVEPALIGGNSAQISSAAPMEATAISATSRPSAVDPFLDETQAQAIAGVRRAWSRRFRRIC